MTDMTMTTLLVILLVTIGTQTEDVPVDPHREIESNLGFVMYRGLVSPASQRLVDTALETLDDEGADENINEIKEDLSDDDMDENNDDDEEETHGRSITKRFLLNTPRKLWPKCVIPYTLDMTTLVPEKVSEILSAMALFEYWTCFRFVPWTATTGQDYGLGHDNHLNFGKHSGCWSHVGMSSAGAPGQNISCCQGKNCIHEIGHALGFSHEQQNPYRDDYVRINYENIQPDNVFAFHKVKAHKRALFPWRYDYTSVMHYGLKAFNKNGRAAITLLDPHMKYLVGEKDSQYYYFLREAESVYRCTDEKCPDFTATCAYDGYLTYREGQCTCRCIAGLDSATNCTTIEGGDKSRNIKWPDDNFSILKVKDVKCPRGSEVGSITHFGQGKPSRNFDVSGSVSAEATKLEFCTFSSGTKRSKNSITWPPGEYCVSRAGGCCPEGFSNGFLQYADARPPVTSGTLPDGNYTLNSKFEFCCRSDGNKDNPIELPVKQPFILWKRDSKACQKVKGAVGIPQHFEFTNRRSKGVAKLREPIPRFKKRYRAMTLHVCLYKPIQTDCGGIIHLTESDSIRELTSPDYPASYRPFSMCTWVIQSPPNTTMLLSFSEFEIPTSSEDPSVCNDKVEIRSFLPGQPGISYCGSGFRSSLVSQTNIMSLILHSMAPRTGNNYFRARVSLAPQGDDLCYLSGDKGWTYRGDVSFTHDLQDCLPWRNVTHCHHHEFAEGDRFAGLEWNKCRSPGQGTRPWCYTHADDCRRDYCDVCGIGECFDILDDCQASKTADFTFCLLGRHIKDGVVGCARTCGLCDTQKSAPASSIRCSSPTSPVEGEPLEALRMSYRVGENVHFRCINGSNIRSQTCLTDGTWAGKGRVCQMCPDDWRIMGNHCYKYFPDPVNKKEAVRQCGNEEGQVAMAKTIYERDFLYNLLLSNPYDIWLGLDDKRSEGTLLWTDGSLLDHERSGLHWNKVPAECHDDREDCAELIGDFPTLCTDFRGFGVRSCAATCRVCARSP